MVVLDLRFDLYKLFKFQMRDLSNLAYLLLEKLFLLNPIMVDLMQIKL